MTAEREVLLSKVNGLIQKRKEELLNKLQINNEFSLNSDFHDNIHIFTIN